MFSVFQQIKSKIASAKHYRKDQMGIINRYLAEGDNWNTHLHNTKKFIISSIPSNINSVAILGSGWLLDVPMEHLIKNVKKIVLIDIYHPKQIVNKYKNYSNIEFVTADLTNGLVDTANKAKSFPEFLSVFNEIKSFPALDQYSFVVSINLLNQLDILLCDLLNKKFNVSDSEFIGIRKKIQQFHVNALPMHKSCLITDCIETNYMNHNNHNEVSNLVYIDLNFIDEPIYWQWDFDSRQSYRQKYNTKFKVVAGNL